MADHSSDQVNREHRHVQDHKIWKQCAAWPGSVAWDAVRLVQCGEAWDARVAWIIRGTCFADVLKLYRFFTERCWSPIHDSLKPASWPLKNWSAVGAACWTRSMGVGRWEAGSYRACQCRMNGQLQLRGGGFIFILRMQQLGVWVNLTPSTSASWSLGVHGHVRNDSVQSLQMLSNNCTDLAIGIHIQQICHCCALFEWYIIETNSCPKELVYVHEASVHESDLAQDDENSLS